MYYARNEFTNELLVAKSAEDAEAGSKALWGDTPVVIGEAIKFDPKQKVQAFLAEYDTRTEEGKVWLDPHEWTIVQKGDLIRENFWNDVWWTDGKQRMVARADNPIQAMRFLSRGLQAPDTLKEANEQARKYAS